MRNEVLDNMVSVTELAKKASAVVAKSETGATQYIVKNNKVVAVLLDVQIYKLIEELSEVWHRDLDDGEWTSIIDYANTVKAIRDYEANPKQPSRSLRDLTAELGFQEGDLQ